jgi:polycomb protein SUZ12
MKSFSFLLRFLFTYVPMSDGARIDVAVSELYDSTYVGNPHDLVTVVGS